MLYKGTGGRSSVFWFVSSLACDLVGYCHVIPFVTAMWFLLLPAMCLLLLLPCDLLHYRYAFGCVRPVSSVGWLHLIFHRLHLSAAGLAYIAGFLTSFDVTGCICVLQALLMVLAFSFTWWGEGGGRHKCILAWIVPMLAFFCVCDHFYTMTDDLHQSGGVAASAREMLWAHCLITQGDSKVTEKEVFLL